jgi:hypothetical protein
MLVTIILERLVFIVMHLLIALGWWIWAGVRATDGDLAHIESEQPNPFADVTHPIRQIWKSGNSLTAAA